MTTISGIQPYLLKSGDTLVISTAKLTLRPLLESDLNTLANTIADREGKLMVSHRLTLTSHSERITALRQALLAGQKWGERMMVWVVIHSSGRLIGARWIEDVSSVVGSGEWSSELSCGGWLKANYRGRGLGKDALLMALHYAARELSAQTILTGTRYDNERAKGNLKACGFVPVPTTDNDLPFLNMWRRDLVDLMQLGLMPLIEAAD